MNWKTAAFVAAIPVLASGCVAETRAGAGFVYEYPVVEAEYVPARIEHYPRARYRGEYVYLVDGRWYYPSPRSRGGWVVFREEPRELRRYRVEGRFDRHPAYREPYPYRGRGDPGYGAPREQRPRRYYPR